MRKSDRILVAITFAVGIVVAQDNVAPDNSVDQGFTDTPVLPGLPWHVHDPARPHPKIVTPGARPGQPPSDATILFDGKDLSKWTAARLGTAAFTVSANPAPWKVANGYFQVVPRSGDIATKEKFGDVQLHVEWQEPTDIRGSSQNRGNSGVFLMGLFEIQILDSYRARTYADGQAGAMYGQWPPLVNAARPPGEWQSYDIVFEAPQFSGDKLKRPASMTVVLNGVLLHNHKAEMGPTIYRQIPKYVAGPREGPIILQDHGSPVRYRNIWARRVEDYDAQ